LIVKKAVSIAPSLKEAVETNIRDRLENWALWCKWSAAQENTDSITGIVCDRLRNAALGNIWCSQRPRPNVDEADALRVERAFRLLDRKQRDILIWTYVRNASPEVICRKLGIPVRPIAVFIEQFRAAETAIERCLV